MTPGGGDGEQLTQRDVEALRKTIDKLDRALERLPDRIEAIYVRKDVYDRDLASLRSAVAEHSSWLEWAQRIVIGIVIVALVSLVIVQVAGRNAGLP